MTNPLNDRLHSTLMNNINIDKVEMHHPEELGALKELLQKEGIHSKGQRQIGMSGPVEALNMLSEDGYVPRVLAACAGSTTGVSECAALRVKELMSNG